MFKTVMHSIFNYWSPLWCGDDNKPSLKRCGAIVFIITTVYLSTKSPEGITIVAALLAACLGLTTYQTLKQNKMDAENSSDSTSN